MYVYILLTKKFKSAWARNEYTLFASSDVFGGHTYSCRRAKKIVMPTTPWEKISRYRSVATILAIKYEMVYTIYSM